MHKPISIPDTLQITFYQKSPVIHGMCNIGDFFNLKRIYVSHLNIPSIIFQQFPEKYLHRMTLASTFVTFICLMALPFQKVRRGDRHGDPR